MDIFGELNKLYFIFVATKTILNGVIRKNDFDLLASSD